MTTGNYANINPANQPEGDDKRPFSALIQVKSSRYFKREYEDPALQPKVAIKWTMGTTRGNTFERTWSTGVVWEDGIISEDGKRITKAFGKNSDAAYLMRKIVAADYPADKIVDDISVFEGEAFYMAEDSNPRSKGSYKGLYPKQYHPEGWQAALDESLARRAARESQQNAPEYTPPVASYNPPKMVQTGDVMKTAAETLVAILQTNGKALKRNQVPQKVSQYATEKKWTNETKEAVAVALWEMASFQSILANTPQISFDGDTLTLKQ